MHAPQTPCSQPTCVPVRPSAWRRKSLSSMRGSTVAVWTTPFTLTLRVVFFSGICSVLAKRGPPPGIAQRAPRQRAGKMPAIVGGRMDVGVGMQAPLQRLRHVLQQRLRNRLAFDACLDFRQAQRRLAHAHHAETDVARHAVDDAQRRRHAGKGKIAVAPRELLEAPARVERQRVDFDRGDELVRLERCHQRADEEVRGGDLPLAPDRERRNRPVKEERHHRHLRGRIGMADAAAERAAIAHRQMRNMMHGIVQDRDVPVHERIRRRHAVPDRRPDAQTFAVFLDTVEAGDAVDVDQDRGLHQAEIDHRHEALAARDDLAVAARGGKGFGGLGCRCRGEIVEGRRLHFAAVRRKGACRHRPAARRIAESLVIAAPPSLADPVANSKINLHY
nr:hypothetical protein SHINE37_41182 [Rhizobiaceae bacterium]